MRLLLYSGDLEFGPVDDEVRAWLEGLARRRCSSGELRPVCRLELLAEGRTAVDAIAGMVTWGDHHWASYYTGDCGDRPDLYPHGDRALVLRRFVVDSVPPVSALPYFHPDNERRVT